MHFIGRWIACTIGCFVATLLVPGITAVGGPFEGPLVCALILAILNSTIKPILRFISLPINVLTFGLFSLVINTIVLLIASAVSQDLFHAGIVINSLLSAVIGALVIAVVTSFAQKALDKE